ncbi:cytochrome P450 [Sciscionella sediminilitoris]|uniref:cytochrome P450 n=1 Tax=Sciscionella sediminilitoris TaxID=1445613 RepID=UPI0004DF4535|nr:cytochrome P450 [Sciscionella sp. SE31]
MTVLASPPKTTDLRPVPGARSWPYAGFLLTTDRLGSARRRFDQYGPISWSNALGRKIVLLQGPDAIGQALSNVDKTIANGPGWQFFIGPFFNRGLMLLDFGEHLHHRRIMQQAFTNERLRGYLDTMNAMIAERIGGWRPRPHFRSYPAVRALTLDVATELFMGGTERGTQKRRVNRAFADTVRAGTSIVRYPLPLTKWRRGVEGRKVLESLLYQRIGAHREGSGRDLFTSLCHAESEDGHRFTDADVVNHMIFLLMAAHDTTTITLATMIGYLGADQQWQDACRAEAFAIGEDTLCYDRLEQCVSVGLAMKEANRLVTPVPSQARQTVADTEILGHFIPKGTLLALDTLFTHHMGEYWPDPERFDPGRFAEDRREDKVHRHAWVPFGGGVHKCIGMHFAGMQVKAVMHQLLRNYRWSVAPDYVPDIDYTALPVPKDGMPVRLERL